jgi:hypothetical protein
VDRILLLRCRVSVRDSVQAFCSISLTFTPQSHQRNLPPRHIQTPINVPSPAFLIFCPGVLFYPRRHFTGIVARMAMSFQYPPSLSARGPSTYSAEEYSLAVLAFGFGGFLTGFVLTTSSKEALDGRIYPSKMNFPSTAAWRLGHQLLLTLCIACFGAAHALFRYSSDGNKLFISSKIVVDVATNQNSIFVVSWLFNVFSSALLNGLLCTGAQITLRAGNMDGHVLDVFMGLSDVLNSRSLRFLWRMRVQMLAIIAFFAGCLIGSLVFQSSFGSSALTFACIALSPMWLLGAVLFYRHHKQSKTHPPRPSDLHAAYVDTARGNVSQLDTRSSARLSHDGDSLSRSHEEKTSFFEGSVFVLDAVHKSQV